MNCTTLRGVFGRIVSRGMLLGCVLGMAATAALRAQELPPNGLMSERVSPGYWQWVTNGWDRPRL